MIRWSAKAFEDLQALQLHEAKTVDEATFALEEGRKRGQALKGPLVSLERLRVGDLRVVYQRAGDGAFVVIRVARRDKVYRQPSR